MHRCFIGPHSHEALGYVEVFTVYAGEIFDGAVVGQWDYRV